MLDKLKQIFLKSGYEEDIYNNYRHEISEQNKRNVIVTSFIGSILMTCLIIVSLFSASVSRVLPLYCAIAILFILIHFIAKLYNKGNDKIPLVCNYLFLFVAFIFAVGLDIIQANPTATTICVLLVALPLLIVDRPYREGIFFLIMSIIFMFESQFIKQSPKASIDILNAVCFFAIGGYLGLKHNQMVLRNIRGKELLQHERDTDGLTNLYNKRAIEEKANAFLELGNVTASIMVIDMDNFKYVNDKFGHHTGDELLKNVACLLSEKCRVGDSISRFGGDEFIIFMPNIDDKNAIEMKTKYLLEEINKLTIHADNEYHPKVCIGLASYPEDGNSYEDIFRKADEAMYYVKKTGKNGYNFYSENIKKKLLVVDDIEMNRAIIRKVFSNEFDVYDAVDGVEALEYIESYPDIELVITDVQMPNMDGIELVRRIRSNPDYNHIAIIANTQHDNPKQEEELYKLGVDDFIYKASSPTIIQMRVHNVLKGKFE